MSVFKAAVMDGDAVQRTLKRMAHEILEKKFLYILIPSTPVGIEDGIVLFRPPRTKRIKT